MSEVVGYQHNPLDVMREHAVAFRSVFLDGDLYRSMTGGVLGYVNDIVLLESKGEERTHAPIGRHSAMQMIASPEYNIKHRDSYVYVNPEGGEPTGLVEPSNLGGFRTVALAQLIEFTTLDDKKDRLRNPKELDFMRNLVFEAITFDIASWEIRLNEVRYLAEYEGITEANGDLLQKEIVKNGTNILEHLRSVKDKLMMQNSVAMEVSRT